MTVDRATAGPAPDALDPAGTVDPAGSLVSAPADARSRRPGLGSFRARLLAAFLVLGIAVLLPLGAGLFVLLRDLHQQAATGALADVAVPVAAQARIRLAALAAGNDGPLSARALQQLRTIEHPDDMAIFLLADDGRVISLDDTGGSAALPDRLDLTTGERRGQVVRGVFRVPGGTPHAYIATTLFGDRAPGGARALVLSRPDDASQRALEDLMRALLLTGFVLVAAGVPLAVVLSRSVTRPLERLTHAAAAVGRGQLPPPLPVEGPEEAAAASASFNAMTQEVADTRRSHAELLASLRHDLRTPLTVIGGFAEALSDGTATGDDASRAARAIAEETARMGRMVDDIAALEDLDAGARRLRLQQLDATSLVRAAVERFAAPARSRGQSVTGSVPSTPLLLVADAQAIERILANLVTNALAAAPEPGGSVIIETGRLSDGSVLLAVRDDGPGIPAAALPHVFERFFRADQSRSGSGSGLGLAIVAELARAHGGRAFAEDPPGGGARVGVTLPVTPPPPEP